MNSKNKIKNIGDIIMLKEYLKQIQCEKEIIKYYLHELQETGLGPGDRPKGWTAGSVKKSGKTLAKTLGLDSPADKDFVDKCIKRLEKHMGKGAAGYCASLKDRNLKSTFWRGKGKTKKQGMKDVMKHQNV